MSMMGGVDYRRVIWPDGRTAIYEVFWSDRGLPLDLGAQIVSQETDTTENPRAIREKIAEAMACEPVYDPVSWPGLPVENIDDLTMSTTDPKTGEIVDEPLDNSVKQWCLEQDKRDQEASLRRRIDGPES